jgi:uncharacterized membrane protein
MKQHVEAPEGAEPFHVAKKHADSLSPLERAAVVITEKVGSMGFFLIIITWTILWCGYNILASQLPWLKWTPFDPFPAFVAYLLISNVIQILLMPLIMVGQNVQGRHADLRAENDYRVNLKAEKEVKEILARLEGQQRLMIKVLENMGAKQDEIEALIKHAREPRAGA